MAGMSTETEKLAVEVKKEADKVHHNLVVKVAIFMSIIAIGCALAVWQVGKHGTDRADSNGCVLKSFLNIGAARTQQSIESSNNGAGVKLSPQQLAASALAVRYEIALANELLPPAEECKAKFGKKYFDLPKELQLVAKKKFEL